MSIEDRIRAELAQVERDLFALQVLQSALQRLLQQPQTFDEEPCEPSEPPSQPA